MRVPDFNNKVNLPRLCKKLGYTDYQYVRLPTFGWFAYNKDKTFIGNVFDVVAEKDRENLYALITKDKYEFLDFDLAYSSMAEAKLNNNVLETQLWTAAYSMCCKAMDSYKINYNNKKQYLKEILATNGLNGVPANKIGVITGKIMDTFKMLPWASKDLRGKLIVPTFCTPHHIASLEYCAWDSPTRLTPLWLNFEKGWYGNIKANRVVSDMKELFTIPGFTWDYKADYWTEGEVKLSEFMDVGGCINIWADAKKTTFQQSPIDVVKDSGKVAELQHYVGKLSFEQLQKIEAETNEPLLKHWKLARESRVQIGDKIYTKRDNKYFVYKKGNLLEVANFTIDIEKIIRKKSGKFYRKGTLNYGEKTVAFEMDEKFFSSNFKFQRGIHDKFLNAGLGIPIVHPDFFSKALLIIDSFNAGVQVEMEE